MPIDTQIYTHNYNFLFELDKNRPVAVKDGRLEEREVPKQEPSYLDLFKAFFTAAATPQNDVAKVINATCRAFIRTVLIENFPLSNNSIGLNFERTRCIHLLKKIDRFDPTLLAPKTRERMNELIDMPESLEARQAMKNHIDPLPLNQTSSGTYILRNRLKQNIGIFKPKLQELGGPKNPSWTLWALGASANDIGIEPGTSCLREKAAYLLDHEHFAKVPRTGISTFAHRTLDTSLFPSSTPPKQEGSFQIFLTGCKPAAGNIPSHEFIDKKELENPFVSIFIKIYRLFMRFVYWLKGERPPGRIHPMAIFDIVTLNCDRHLQNVLVDSSGDFHPIDHGQILPANAYRLRLDWKHLKESDTSFTSDELLYIKKLDGKKNEKILRECGITDQNVFQRMNLAIHLLKVCASKGFTPHQIATLMTYPIDGSNAFERKICTPILTYGKDANSVIETLADNYLNFNKVV